MVESEINGYYFSRREFVRKTLHKTNDENQATKHVIYQNMGVINKGGLDDGS